MTLSGLVARFGRVAGNRELRVNSVGNLGVDRVLPEYAELALARHVFNANTGAGTAIAPVTAMPTTTATWALYNAGEPGSGDVLIPLSAYCWSVSGTLGLGMSLVGTVALAKVVGTRPTAYVSSVNTSFSGGRASTAIFAQAITMVGTPAWAVLASRDQVSAISVGSGLVADVKGMMLIPPGYVGALTVVAPVGTTALFGCGFVYATVEADLLP